MKVKVLIDTLNAMPPDAEVIVRLGFLEPHHLRQIDQVKVSHWHGEYPHEGEDRMELHTDNHHEPPF